MRLIDADALKSKIDLSPKYADVIRTWIDNAPTVCDIEQIRAEIEQKMSIKPNEFNQHDESDYDRGLGMALFIIDKYTKNERKGRNKG